MGKGIESAAEGEDKLRGEEGLGGEDVGKEEGSQVVEEDVGEETLFLNQIQLGTKSTMISNWW